MMSARRRSENCLRTRSRQPSFVAAMSQPWLKKQINALELYTVDVIYGRRAGAGPALYGAFLQILSWLFNGVAQARLWLYQRRIFFHDQPLGCLVVVVGNLTVGGTGKTPVVEKFAK